VRHDFLDDRPYVRIEEATQPSPHVYVSILASDRALMLEAARALAPFSG
jgi:hypothetical protein